MPWWRFKEDKDGNPSHITEHDDGGDPLDITPQDHGSRVSFTRDYVGQGTVIDHGITVIDSKGSWARPQVTEVRGDFTVFSEETGNKVHMVHLRQGASTSGNRDGTVQRKSLMEFFNQLVSGPKTKKK